MSFGSLLMLVLICFLAPALPALATRTRALLTGRRGTPVLQGYRDLARLLRKGVVYSRTTTPVFRLAPVVALTTTLVAAALLPLDGRSALLSFPGDLVAFTGLLGLGRFVLVLAALDTGSSFEGMGASREVTIAAFAEPALLLCLSVLVLATEELSLTGMLGGPLAARWSAAAPSLVLAAAALFMLTLAETSRGPVDDPATHLELTMIHEVMVLDHSGPDLALLLLANAVKLALFGVLVTAALVPLAGVPPLAVPLVLLVGLGAVAVAIGVVEAILARLRLNRIPQFLVATTALAVFAVILLLR